MFQSLVISPTYSIHTAAVTYDRSEEMFHSLNDRRINLEHLKGITNKKRKAEWMFIREIISDIMPEGEDIIYDVHRKPRFKNSNFFLSISHSNERVAIAVDQKNETGIDVQHVSEKIIRIKSKFLNDLELSTTSQDPTELTCYWCIKEALFKIYGKTDAFLKENFEVQHLEFDGKTGKALGITRSNGRESFQNMELRMLDNYMMAYSVNY